MKNYLIAFDSDGCVFDAMESKHRLCFVPAGIKIFGLESIEQEFTNEWYAVNLYSKTRGINRFPALILVFDRLRGKKYNIPKLDVLRNWIKTTNELSARQLKKDAQENQNSELTKVMEWSEYVNRLISERASDGLPYKNARPAFEAIREIADIAVVSSANMAAIEHEWTKNGFIDYVSEFFGQEQGTKKECLKLLKEKGYEHMLMVGDAPGDKDAAEANGCLFYPIVPGDEENSWIELKNKVFTQFIDDCYSMNNEYIKKFEQICG